MTRSRSTKPLLAALIVLVAATGCREESTVAPAFEGTGTLLLSFSGLPRLAPGYLYEGWIVVDGSPLSTGTFQVDTTGQLNRARFEIAPVQLLAATKFVVSIEPDPDPDPAPSASKMLAGDFAGNEARLTVADPAAFGSDLRDAAGVYILETPTTATIADDYALGIWWLDPATGPGPGLSLPDLPAGWIYEGWVVNEFGPRSTGRFRSVAGDDSDGAGAEAGADGSPPFPGQDFINPPRDLVGWKAVISVEPEPDDAPGPFVLKPLVDENVEDLGPGVTQPMNNNAANFPTGFATR